MSTALLDEYRKRFIARDDVYAEGYFKDGKTKASYAKQVAPLTDEILYAHAAGRKLIGTYQLLDTKVRWFCVDIDHPKDDDGNVLPDPFPVAYADAKRQQARLEAAGLHVYLERSRSGEGVHVWGFFDEWVEAAEVRRAIRPLLIDSATVDRLYPVQDAATEDKPYGNLIALPYNGEASAEGNSVFLDAEGNALSLKEALLSFHPNSPAVIARLAAKAPKDKLPARTVSMGMNDGRPARPLKGVLKLVSPYGCEFMRNAYKQRRTLAEPAWYAAVQQLTCFEQGRDAAHVFSQGYEGYNAAEVDQKFDHALENPPVGCAYIHEHFPKLACKSCPLTAPYRRAERKLADLIQDGGTELKRGGFGSFLPRVRRLDSGEEVSGIRNRLGALDQYTRFRPSELTVVGAQVSIGKTASMIHIAANVARQAVPAFVFSAEMGDDGLRERFLAHFSGVDSRALRGERRERLSAQEWEALEKAAAEIDGLPLYLNFTATRPETILNAIEHAVLKARRPLEDPYVFFFDYLQFAAKEAGDMSPVEKISRTAKELKLITKITEQAGCTFSQVIRPAEGADEPSITWFKGSGDIEAETDVGIIWTGERIEGRTAPRVATIVKQRNGQANVRAEYLLDQATNYYEPLQQHTLAERKPLFEKGELGYGEDDAP